MSGPPRTGRVRAVLALGLLVGLAPVATAASWTDAAQVTGTTFSSGTLDIQVNNADSVASTTLSMSTMVPGSSAAEVITVRNAGTAALTYTVSGGLGGTHGADFASNNALKLTIRAGGTRSGTGNSATCTGGTGLASAVALTTNTSTAIVNTAQGPLAAAATAPLCFQVQLDTNAASSLQGKSATATFTVTGTSTP